MADEQVEVKIEQIEDHWEDQSKVIGDPDKYYEWALENDKTAMAGVIKKGFQKTTDPKVRAPYGKRREDGTIVRQQYYETLVLIEMPKKMRAAIEQKKAELAEKRNLTPVPEARGVKQTIRKVRKQKKAK